MAAAIGFGGIIIFIFFILTYPRRRRAADKPILSAFVFLLGRGGGRGDLIYAGLNCGKGCALCRLSLRNSAQRLRHLTQVGKHGVLIVGVAPSKRESARCAPRCAIEASVRRGNIAARVVVLLAVLRDGRKDRAHVGVLLASVLLILQRALKIAVLTSQLVNLLRCHVADNLILDAVNVLVGAAEVFIDVCVHAVDLLRNVVTELTHVSLKVPELLLRVRKVAIHLVTDTLKRSYSPSNKLLCPICCGVSIGRQRAQIVLLH